MKDKDDLCVLSLVSNLVPPLSYVMNQICVS